MGQSSIHTERGTPPESRVTWFTWMLVGILFVLILLAVVLYFTHSRPKVVDALHGDSETATGALSDVLAKTPSAKRPPLLLKYTQDASPGLRYAAVDALGEERTPKAAEAIERAFTDSASNVRQRALEVLTQVDPERGLRLLLAGLRDEDSWIREAAVTQLALFIKHPHSDVKRAVPTLITVLGDPDPVIPTISMNILRKLTGQPWRITKDSSADQKQEAIRHWQDWWGREKAHWVIPPGFADIAPIRPTRVDPAPDFQLQDVNGRSISLAAQRGRVTLLNFWGTWCSPCQQEIPDLVKLDQTYRARGLDIIGVALSESNGAEGLRRWCKDHHIEYRQALSTDAIQDAYGHIEEVPVSVLIDKQGRIRYRWEGERDFDTFSAAAQRLLQE